MNKKPIHYSILDLAIVAQGNTIQQTYNNTLKLAQKAETFGYHRFWLAEHHNMPTIASNAPSILIGYVAQGTNTIKVGSGGIMLPNHAPIIVVEQFSTLANLYPNRIDLGLGRAPGTDQETAHTIRADFREASQHFPKHVQEIQNFFSEENVSESVRVPIAEGLNVPIYILGSSTDSAHLAAKKGLPYAFASHFATSQLLNALTIYRNEFKPSETLTKPYVITGINVVVADTDEEAERLSTSFIKMIIGILTGKRQPLSEPSPMTDELRGIMEHPSVQQMIKYSFIGSKATVKKQLHEFINQTQTDEIIVATHIYNTEAKIYSYQLLSEIIKEL
ncbi:LLM class flavin-dependent oxidoreductase [Wenyingzhuangia sp. IMCC45467]